MRKWLSERLGDIGPNRDAHNERIKLLATSINAAGIAAMVTGVFAPLFDAQRRVDWPAAPIGVLFWAACVLAAFEILGYIKSKD